MHNGACCTLIIYQFITGLDKLDGMRDTLRHDGVCALKC